MKCAQELKKGTLMLRTLRNVRNTNFNVYFSKERIISWIIIYGQMIVQDEGYTHIPLYQL